MQNDFMNTFCEINNLHCAQAAEMLRMEAHLSADAIASFRLAARQAASAAEAVQVRLNPIVCFCHFAPTNSQTAPRPHLA